MLIFALLSSSPSISFHLLPSSSCSSPHHFLHRSFFLFLYITVTVRCGNSRPSALSPFSIFFLKHPSLSLFFFVLTCSPVPLLPFRLPSSFPPRPDLSSNHFFSFSLHLNFSLDHFIFFLSPAALVTAPFSSHHFTPLLIFTFGYSTFWGDKMCRLLRTLLPCPSFSLLSQARLLHLGEEGWRAPPTGQSRRCFLALRDAQQIR